MINFKFLFLNLGLLFFISGLTVKGQSFFYDELNSLVEDSFNEFVDFCLENEINSFKLKINCENEILKNLIINRLGENFKISFDESSKYELNIFSSNFLTRVNRLVSYPLFGEKKFEIEHILTVEYNLIDHSSSKLVKSQQIKKSILDTLTMSEVQNFKIDYTEANHIPFWRTALEPTIVTSAAVFVVYVLFTIRSK